MTLPNWRARFVARSLGRSVDRSIARSIDRTLHRPIDRSVARSIARSLDLSFYLSQNQSTTFEHQWAGGIRGAIEWLITSLSSPSDKRVCLLHIIGKAVISVQWEKPKQFSEALGPTAPSLQIICTCSKHWRHSFRRSSHIAH